MLVPSYTFTIWSFLYRGFGEEDPEGDGDAEGEAGEDIPGFSPAIPNGDRALGCNLFRHNEFIDDHLCGECTDGSTETVGHHHKESLRRGALLGCGLLVHIECTGDIEEIKGKAIDDAAEHEEDDAGEAGVTCAEESEAEDPGEHRHEHDILDTEFLEEERNSEDTEGFADLGDRNQDIRVLHAESIGKLFDGAKGSDKGVGVGVRHLEAHTEHHREDEEECHFLLFEEGEGFESKCFYEVHTAFCGFDLASREGEGVGSQDEAESTADDELPGSSLEAEEVNDPHGRDEADSTEDTDGREVLNRIHAGFDEGIESDGVGERDGRHEECDGEGVEGEQRAEVYIGGREGIHTCCAHKQAGEGMAETEGLLRLDPAVCDDTHEGRHEETNYTLDGIEPSDVLTKPLLEEVGSHRG